MIVTFRRIIFHFTESVYFHNVEYLLEEEIPEDWEHAIMCENELGKHQNAETIDEKASTICNNTTIKKRASQKDDRREKKKIKFDSTASDKKIQKMIRRELSKKRHENTKYLKKIYKILQKLVKKTKRREQKEP